MQITLRQAREEDILETAVIYVECVRKDYTFIPPERLESLDPETEAAECREWLDGDPKNRVIAAFDGGHMAGYIALGLNLDEPNEYEGEITGFFTRPAYRGKGIGLRLLIAGLEYFRGLGFSRVLLYNFSDSASNAYYQRLDGRHLGSVTQQICGKPLEVDIFGWEIEPLLLQISDHLPENTL